MGYAIRPAVNPDLQTKIGCLLKRPAGGIRFAFYMPASDIRRTAGSWDEWWQKLNGTREMAS